MAWMRSVRVSRTLPVVLSPETAGRRRSPTWLTEVDKQEHNRESSDDYSADPGRGHPVIGYNGAFPHRPVRSPAVRGVRAPRWHRPRSPRAVRRIPTSIPFRERS
jgi:hypothetical protein